MTKKKILVLAVLACVLALGVAAATWAFDPVPTVVFDAAAKTFSFQNCQEYTYGDENGDGVAESYPDLFPNIKNAMPGDSFTQTIRVKVINAGSNTVKMYLKSENPNADYKKLVAANGDTVSLTARFGKVGAAKRNVLTVAKDFIKGEDKSLTYTSPLANQLYLGAFTGNAKDREVDVSFTIQTEAGNELSGLTAMIDWVFVAEIIPDTPGPGPGPGGTDTDEHEDSRGTWHIDLVDYHVAYVIGRDDGRVYPEAPITRAEATTIFFRLMTDECRAHYWKTVNTYYDVPSDAWYNNAVSTMTNAGVIEGYPDGAFRPDAPITRAEFVTIVSRIVTANKIVSSKFSDMDGHWAVSAVDNAVSLGVVTGYPDGSFRPEESITRAEVMAICNRLMGRLLCEESLPEGMLEWVDNMDTAKWYYLDVQEATNSHLHRLGGGQELYADYEYWVRLIEGINWKKLEQPDSTAVSIYRSNEP